MAKEVGEEAAHKLKATDNEHVCLETIPVVIDRVLYGVVETIIAGLGKAQHNQRDEVLSLQKCVF
jgi:hypothetical protein